MDNDDGGGGAGGRECRIGGVFGIRGDLDINVGVVFVGVLLTIGDVRRGVNAIGVRGVAIEFTVDGVC